MKKITILFLLLHVIGLKAQIGNEIMAYTDSSELMMTNGKKLMMECLQNKEYSKASEVYFYLQEEAIKQGSLAFSYTDILYINLINHNFGEWLDYAKHYEEKVNLPIFNSNTQLTERLYNIAKNESDEILSATQDNKLTDEEITVIKTFLHIVEEETLGNEYRQQKTKFKKDFPSSKYGAFLEIYLPKAPIKYSWNGNFGVAVISPMGTYGDNFYTSSVFFGAMDFNISNIYASLFINAGGLSVEKPFVINGISFKKNDYFSYFDGGIQLGYLVINSKRFHIAPYATLGGASLRTNMYEDYEDDDLEIDMIGTFVYGAGLHTEIKLYEGNSIPYYSYMYGISLPNTIKQHIALKANIGYNFLANSKYSLSKGNTLYAQIGIVYGMGIF